MNLADSVNSASFRDPSGFIFRRNDRLYRQINTSYREDYQSLIDSGLYEKLVGTNSLIPHEEVGIVPADDSVAYKIIEPAVIPFISYPYEWTFTQLKDAALLTLEVQLTALHHNISLKDASAYNVQFLRGKPIFIDTLSFERRKTDEPWVAYRQFCQHFLCPLALMCYTDIRLNQIMKIFVDGVPIDFASRMLPFRTQFHWSLLAHIHLHAKAQQRYADSGDRPKVRRKAKISALGLRGIVVNLKNTINKLHWTPKGTEWANYYDQTNYSSLATDHKSEVVSKYLDDLRPDTVWDLGANVGNYSRLACSKGVEVISFDSDPAATEINYLKVKSDEERNLLPLIVDLCNPSGGIGWSAKERISLLDRAPVDTVLALALVHHLAISNNVPLSMIAEFFARICRSLIVEFVPKEDSQVQKLLLTRDDIFDLYHQGGFESAFKEHFEIQESCLLRNSARLLYKMTKSN
ncbi:MAG: SAM-dependent methyltransferase [Gammaproteobacteria bacterium]|nr:SAM-dependent methyltransferase [Gammaproteobacteria bacterium]MDH3465500.1 SAM-dependent methyltransferase [Gammaproteobacteria bacterium]